MSTYLMLHLLFGLVAGGVICVLRRPDVADQPVVLALACALGGAACVLLMTAIGHFPSDDIDDAWRVNGTIALGLGFVLVLLVAGRPGRK